MFHAVADAAASSDQRTRGVLCCPSLDSSALPKIIDEHLSGRPMIAKRIHSSTEPYLKRIRSTVPYDVFIQLNHLTIETR